MPERLRSSGLALVTAIPSLVALVAVLAVLAPLALLAGCGRTETVGAGRTLQLGLSEYRLTPQNARVSVGVLTIIVHNYGVLTHNLVVTSGGHTVDSTHPIWPGRSAELALSLAPGTYTMASTIQSDQSLGEYGTLTVTS